MEATIKLDPNDIRELVEETMREEIRAALVGQLDNMVVGEMAKMKLFKPGSSDLATMITNKVNRACSQAMSSERLYDVMHRAAVERGRQIAKLRLLQPNSSTLGDLVAAELKKQTSSLVTASRVSTEVQRLVKAEIDKAITPLAQQVKSALSEATAAKVRA